VETLAVLSEAGAERVANEVLDASARLELFPESGRRLPEFPNLPHREVIVDKFRLVYRVAPEAVWIITIVPAASDMTRASLA
jgi:toxin ParE1/3/4